MRRLRPREHRSASSCCWEASRSSARSEATSRSSAPLRPARRRRGALRHARGLRARVHSAVPGQLRAQVGHRAYRRILVAPAPTLCGPGERVLRRKPRLHSRGARVRPDARPRRQRAQHVETCFWPFGGCAVPSSIASGTNRGRTAGSSGLSGGASSGRRSRRWFASLTSSVRER